ncbi:MAG: cell wall-binding repeat-containing protein [Clostridia bacterium]|nr:cell wall-binding repeat-containing protein [Clostridia bacterium]
MNTAHINPGRVIAILLTVLVVLTCFVPAGVSADTYDSDNTFTFSDSGITVLDEGGSGFKISGTSLTINASGTYVVTGNCSDGSVKVKKGTTGVTLILKDLDLTSLTTAPVACNKMSQVDIVIDGEVSLKDSINNSEDYLINTYGYAEDASELEDAENAVIKCKGGSVVTITGSGTLNITAKAKNGIKSGATLDADGDETAADSTSEYFASLIMSGITLNADTTGVYIPDSDTYGDAINGESYVWIKSGTYNINAGDDGIKCDYTLDIGAKGASNSALDINVTKCVEGIEGSIVNFYSGDIDITATDDCVNAANSDLSGYQFGINVEGGDIYCVSGNDGDAFDSNGTITINGGKVVVFGGPNGNAFDTGTDGDNSIDDSFMINGGTVFGAGTSQMAIVPEMDSQDWVAWGYSSQGGQPPGPGWNPGGSSQSTNMSDASSIKLKVGNSSYSVGSNVNISANSKITVLNGNLELFGTTAANQAGYVLFSGNMTGTAATYTVTYDGNGGTGTMASLTVSEGDSITVSGCSFTNEGYEFDGWNLVADGSGISYAPGDSLTVTGNITLYAQWKDDGTEAVNLRIYGSDRYATAMKSADYLMDELGIDEFDTVILAYGGNYPDALTGDYLAAVSNAPMLLICDSKSSEVIDYIDDNLVSGGKVYILGGEGVVSADIFTKLDSMGYDVERLGGSTRYETNLQILEECGPGEGELLVCSGTNYPDALSASSSGRPIMIVGNSLTDDQRNYIETSGVSKIFIVGGTGAVSQSVEDELESYGIDIGRFAGANRYETSVLTAEGLYESPGSVMLVYAGNFPDGLSGGPAAYAGGMPLLLVDDSHYSLAANYAGENAVSYSVTLGGAKLISNDTIKAIVPGKIAVYS